MLSLNETPLQQSCLKRFREISKEPVDGEILYCLQLMEEVNDRNLDQGDRYRGEMQEEIPSLMWKDQKIVLRKILGIWESEEPALTEKVLQASTADEAGEIFLTMLRTALA